VHIYSLRTKDGHFTLEQGPHRIASHAKIDLPGRRGSPAPPDIGIRSQISNESSYLGAESPKPSEPSTPTAHGLPMNPPSTISHSRRSSFGSSTSMRRSASPAPSMPLPAVMPMEASPKPGHGLGVKNANIYANETLTSFFRRLTFTQDGSLLLTPAGQYSIPHPGENEGHRAAYEIINTVYIYTRGGINKPPIAHLPGHKKPSVAVKCSPIFYTIREGPVTTKNITIDTSSSEESIPALPEPAISSPTPGTPPKVQKSPFLHPSDPGPTSTPKKLEVATGAVSPGPPMAFSLPYRMVYAVATQDSVLLYDTQQQTPLCIVSNLHCATFTDLTWYVPAKPGPPTRILTVITGPTTA
jgi:chromatin assembly factor 1 subunit B